jgi:hypothetical protein
MEGEEGGNNGASQTPKPAASSAESPPEKIERNLEADLLKQAQPGAADAQQEAAALAEEQRVVAAEALRVATERALAAASPKAGAHTTAKAGGFAHLPAPPMVAARVQPQLVLDAPLVCGCLMVSILVSSSRT